MTAGRINQIHRFLSDSLLGVTPSTVPTLGTGPASRTQNSLLPSFWFLETSGVSPRREVLARVSSTALVGFSFGWPQHTGSPIRCTAPDLQGVDRAVAPLSTHHPESGRAAKLCLLRPSDHPVSTHWFHRSQVCLARGHHSTVTPLPGLSPL